ncbi:ATP-binding protein, partial [Campylobacter jejuni]|nr:ATP-binding protein [Campylobacter jejuni]
MIKAFSLLEFVFIILILGIVFNLGSLYLKKDNLLEGAIQILNDIQYTQSLAMMQEGIRVDELAIAKREWFKSKWQIYFIKSAATGYDQTYTIFLDKNGDGNANLGKTEINIDREIAVDVINHNKLMNSGQSGVIGKDDEKTLAKNNSDCIIRLLSKKDALCIVIDTLSGYAYIPDFKTLKSQFVNIKNKNYEC